MTRPLHLRSLLVPAVGLMAAAVGLSACGGGSHSAAASTGSTTPTTAPSGGAGGAATAGRGFPGTSGSVAAITGSSMEVQSASNGQTTVEWTSTTGFTETDTLKAAAVATGDCVTVTGTTSGSKLTARSVVITEPVKGGCPVGAGRGAGAFGGFGAGGRPGGAGRAGSGTSSPPSSTGGTTPTRRSFPGAADFGFAGGKVVSATATTLVLTGYESSGFHFSRPGSSGSSTTSSTTVPSSKRVTVTLGSSTTFTRTIKATAKSLAVGDCVTAIGSANSIGTVKASRVSITSTGGKTCTPTFGGGGGFGGGFGGAPGAPSGAAAGGGAGA